MATQLISAGKLLLGVVIALLSLPSCSLTSTTDAKEVSLRVAGFVEAAGIT